MAAAAAAVAAVRQQQQQSKRRVYSPSFGEFRSTSVVVEAVTCYRRALCCTPAEAVVSATAVATTAARGITGVAEVTIVTAQAAAAV